MTTLTHLFASKVKAQIFQLLFDGTGTRLHGRELARRAGLTVATVRQELRRLTGLELVTAQVDGNRTYYQANAAHPLYKDWCSIVRKTSGLVPLLGQALAHPGIRIAFVFGSMARGEARAQSDIDLLVVGTIGMRALTKCLSGLSAQLGREINPHILTPAEFHRRKTEGEHFLSSVLATPRTFVVGNEHELETMG